MLAIIDRRICFLIWLKIELPDTATPPELNLMTCGAEFIGSRLVDRRLERGEAVIGFESGLA